MSFLVLDSGVYIASIFPDEKLKREAKAVLMQAQADKIQLAAMRLCVFVLSL